jgi:hypothetical protein
MSRLMANKSLDLNILVSNYVHLRGVHAWTPRRCTNTGGTMAIIYESENFIVESYEKPLVSREEGGHIRLIAKDKNI